MIASPRRITASTPLVSCQNSGRENATRSRAIRCSMFLQTCGRTGAGSEHFGQQRQAILPLVDGPAIARVTLAAPLEAAPHRAVQAADRILGGNQLAPAGVGAAREAAVHLRKAATDPALGGAELHAEARRQLAVRQALEVDQRQRTAMVGRQVGEAGIDPPGILAPHRLIGGIGLRRHKRVASSSP